MPRPQQSRPTARTVPFRTVRAGCGTLLGALLLAACGQTTRVPEQTARTFAYTATVPVAANDTESGTAARYTGTVIVWHPEAGFAVLGLDRPVPAGTLSSLSVNGRRQVRSEVNRQRFEASGTNSAWSGRPGQMNAEGSAYLWSGGSANLWSGGSASLWSGGSASLWSGGSSVWSGLSGGIPENRESMTRIGVPDAWRAAPKLGQDVKVAVIDSGIDLNHPMFQGSLTDASEQWDFVDDDPVPQEEGGFSDGAYGHGTSVAGIVLQLSPHSLIMPLRALRPDGSGDQTTVASAINYAVTHGAKVINLSLGSTEETETIQTMIDYAASQGVSVVASSGNTGDARVTSPAREAREDGRAGDLTFSVGSVDGQDRKSHFSTYGRSLELMAPGETVWGPVPGNLFSYWSGTSMAAPMVSGALALARAEAPTADPVRLSTSLLNTAEDISALNPDVPVGRRLNVAAFIQALDTLKDR